MDTIHLSCLYHVFIMPLDISAANKTADTARCNLYVQHSHAVVHSRRQSGLMVGTLDC